MTRPALRRITQFHHKDPEEQKRQLSQLEENLDAAISGLVSVFEIRFRPLSTKDGNCSVIVDDLVPISTARANVKVTFPQATLQNAGQFIGVVQTDASHTLTIVPVGGNVMGASSYTVAANVGLFLFISLANGWWKVVA